MKVVRIVVWLMLSAIGLPSCYWLFGHEEPEYDGVAYNLALGFRDASGKDLVEGIGLRDWWENVLPDLYELEILRSGSRVEIPASLRMERYGADCYFIILLTQVVEEDRDEEQLTYRLKCPYVFGDDAVHELITDWIIPKNKTSSNEYSAHCSRIEFEGNEIIPDICDDGNRKRYRTVLTVSSLGERK